MDPACDFPRDYVPAEGPVDPALELHVRHCADCQAEFRPVGGLPSYAHSALGEA